MCAERARQHARDAELSAERTCIALERLQKLCEPSFDEETMQAFKQLITTADGSRPIMSSNEQASHMGS